MNYNDETNKTKMKIKMKNKKHNQQLVMFFIRIKITGYYNECGTLYYTFSYFNTVYCAFI
jgi:hypothetical protein